MIEAKTLRIDILDWWHCGTGIGGGFADARIDRDPEGLPCVPGRHLKGILRDAALRAERWDALPRDATVELFGGDPAETEELDPEAPRPRPEPGALRVSTARLAPEVRARLRRDPRLRAVLTALFAQTAVDPVTGTAREKHLRRMEMTVPLELFAEVRWIGRQVGALADCWPHLLADAVFPLVFALGADRTRGLGRVELSWVEE